MVQNQRSMRPVLRHTRDSIASTEDRTKQSTVSLEQRLQLKRKAMLRALVGLCLSLLALTITLVDPLTEFGRLYMTFSEGYPGYDMFARPPIGSYIRAYVFNVTNMEQFLKGEENMKLQEVGPFTYREYRTNDNVTVDWERGIIRYVPMVNVTFLPEHSIGHPKDYRLVMPNTALLSVTSMLTEYPMWTNMAFNLLLRNLGTLPYVHLTAEEYMWNSTDPLVRMAYKVLPGFIETTNVGILAQFYYGSGEHYAEMDADQHSRYRISNWNGAVTLPYWKDGNETGSVCNNLKGSYEGMFFTPGFTLDTKFHLYRRQMCRTVPMVAVGTDVTSFGVNVIKFSVADDAFDPKPENDCVCKNGKCLPRGLSSMAPCNRGMAITLSKPHFLDADPAVFYKLEGLAPSKLKHESLVKIDPVLGLPLNSSSSSQINICIGDARYSSIAKPFSNIHFPLLWANLEYEPIPDDIQLILRWRFIFGPIVLAAIEILLLASGVSVLAYNVFRYYRPLPVAERREMYYHQSLPVDEKETEQPKNPLMDDIKM